MKWYVHYLSFCVCSLMLAACEDNTKQQNLRAAQDKPQVLEQGRILVLPNQPSVVRFFEVEQIQDDRLTAEIIAPARVAATVVPSKQAAIQNLVLFDHPELSANYMGLIQHKITLNQIQNISIRQKKIELDRVQDLARNGAATGKEVLEAQTLLAIEETNLANQKAALIEHESKLKEAGFEPSGLLSAPLGYVWLICDVPENQIHKLTMGSTCKVRFTALPDEEFVGKIEGTADVVDNLTRMLKLRIALANPNGQIRAGMFATVSFGVAEGDYLTVSPDALITVQGKSYVFVRHDKRKYERREVQLGQQINRRIVVFGGLKVGEAVVVKGAMQLKGLSFGY